MGVDRGVTSRVVTSTGIPHIRGGEPNCLCMGESLTPIPHVCGGEAQTACEKGDLGVLGGLLYPLLLKVSFSFLPLFTRRVEKVPLGPVGPPGLSDIFDFPESNFVRFANSY